VGHSWLTEGAGASGAGEGAAASGLDGYLVEEQVGFLLRRAHQRHVALFQEAMADADLTPTQFTALIKVVELGRATQNQLGRLVATDPATIQGVVQRLIARGLVGRAADPMDRRSAVLTPTETGLALAQRAVGLARGITAATLEPLNAAERSHFLALLRKLS
jgi:MarR family transcriptional regulator, lower aerobic nicotinate degradation pathway regulator